MCMLQGEEEMNVKLIFEIAAIAMVVILVYKDAKEGLKEK